VAGLDLGETEMALIVTNVGLHALDFAFRTRGGAGVQTEHIPVGAQARITVPTDEALAIVAHHRNYGLVPLAEIETARGQRFGACYSIGSPAEELAPPIDASPSDDGRQPISEDIPVTPKNKEKRA
jgi:hypothetical protein